MQKEKIWTTNQGKMILISKMDDYHLQNSIKMLYKIHLSYKLLEKYVVREYWDLIYEQKKR